MANVRLVILSSALIIMLFPALGFTLNDGIQNDDDGSKHCLAPDTKITMSDDVMMDISDVKEGDAVLSFNVITREYETAKVMKVHSMMNSRFLRVRVSNGTYIEVTADHPFLTPTGWTSASPEHTQSYERYQDEEVSQLGISTGLYYYDVIQNKVLNVISIDGFLTVSNSYSLELDNDGAYIANSLIVGQE